MTRAEVKDLALAIAGFETYDTVPSRLEKFVADGERVVGQAVLDANPWIFSVRTETQLASAAKSVDLSSLVGATPSKVLTVGQASGNVYYWLPALSPVELIPSPDAGGYNQPYKLGWAYIPPLVWFSATIPAGQKLLIVHATPPEPATADEQDVLGGYEVLKPFAAIVAYHAAVLMKQSKGEPTNDLATLYIGRLRYMQDSLKELQGQALTHIPVFGERAEP